jgi:hypothetical protein
MQKKLYTAIMFFHYKTDQKPMKYRKIYNKDKFEQFAISKGALYINYYDRETKQFDGRVWLTDWR